MSATAPSDEAWAALLTQVATLQAKHASIESRLEVIEEDSIIEMENRIVEMEHEPTFDPSVFAELCDEVRALRQYVATRDDISEMRRR